MKINNMTLPANCSKISKDEMLHIDGGFELTAPVVAAGVAVIAVGAMGLNLLSWFTGNRETNFIQDAMTAGANFINGAVNAGQNFLDGLLGK